MNNLEDAFYLVENVVRHYLPDRRVEDLRACGFAGLVEAWPNRPEGEKEIPWLISRIKYAILEFFEDDDMIRIPRRSIGRGVDRIRVFGLLEEHDKQHYDDSLPSAINDLPLDAEEKQMVKWLAEGRTMAEIAEITGTNAMKVFRIIKVIRTKTTNYFEEQ